MGHFRLGACKRQPYETDIRIPALFAGPGIAPRRALPAVAGIPDIAPTVLELAGVTDWAGSSRIDGRSLAKMLLAPARDADADADAGADADADVSSSASASASASAAASVALPSSSSSSSSTGAAPWRDAYLIEYYSTSNPDKPDPSPTKDHLKDSLNNTFVGLRVLNATMDLVYFEFSNIKDDFAFRHANFCELYNISSDPDQLVNMCEDGSASDGLKAALHKQLYKQFACEGAGCA